ncbi:organic cation transporter protein-like isoform X1 [Amphibalanus amphitrite]|nr:organic cation transporter protein-like isoform X1 [Amphibalanus amphitrite]XP_043239459.1 organic cation transporter protein-like isoform X1 [Amphibalanus amphitrite]XP_043239460.1 organic cation transporter protein-like isoform X1 [Amphibalanus amphitrite]XP_043239461.1 organic cation transporter protein-like isoform X1 [Amphibalanus amphitrite]XP_043239462.1 organic cation transporter protein-like isoform X1 [Amphibalanus amphitrite]XP_043239463.1 organic cation transporter protein-like 
MPRHEIDFDKILSEIGDFGRYQVVFYCFLCAATAIAVLPGVVALVFQTYVPHYRCMVPGCDNVTSPQYVEPFTNFTIPTGDECRRFWRYNLTADTCADADFDDNITVSCTEFVFDDSMFKTSFATQWNLTCHYQPLVELPNTLYFSGVLLGSVVFGVISDRFGRKAALMLAVLIINLVGYLVVLLRSSFVAVCVLRVLLGLASCGMFQTPFVMAVELVGKRWRVPCGTALNYFTTLGALVAGGLGYAIRDWVQLQLVVTAPLLLLFAGFWLCPESVRWLLTQGRTRDAERLIRKIAETNGTTVSPHLLADYDAGGEEEEGDGAPSQRELRDPVRDAEETSSSEETLIVPAAPSETFLDCMRSRVLRLRLLLALLGWFAVNFAFYGMVVDLPNMPGDFFTNYFVAGVAEIPGYTLSWVGMDRLGRRITFVLATVLGGVSIMASGLIPNAMPIPSAVLLMLGKCGASGAFAVIYIYTSELFPTSARNTAVGVCSMTGRISAMLAPQLAVLSVYGESIPLLVIGGVSVVAGLFTLLLPETLGLPLPETMHDAVSAARTVEVRTPPHTDEDRE